jgi:hypothetical protein
LKSAAGSVSLKKKSHLFEKGEEPALTRGSQSPHLSRGVFIQNPREK